jgi:hypothetical protein
MESYWPGRQTHTLFLVGNTLILQRKKLRYNEQIFLIIILLSVFNYDQVWTSYAEVHICSLLVCAFDKVWTSHSEVQEMVISRVGGLGPWTNEL